ncbi:MAG: glycosyltransferase family 2 protein [Bacillota bacterium]
MRIITPRVSVIIPCFNHGRFLRHAAESVLAQTLADLELIIVDDGSTDDTPAVLAGLDDRRVRTCRTSNRGVSAARNAGLDMVRGEFVAFLDADDLWEPDKLARQVAIMDSEPDVTLVFTDLRRFSPTDEMLERQFTFVPELSGVRTRPARAGEGAVIVEDAFAALAPLRQLPAWIQTSLLRAAATADLRFPEGIRLAEDLHYIMRAYLRGRAAYIAEPLVAVRRHEQNSYRTHAEMLRPVIRVLELLQREPLAPPHRSALRLRTGRAWLELAHFHFWDGSPLTAAVAYARAAWFPGHRGNALLHLVATPVLPALRKRLRPRGLGPA